MCGAARVNKSYATTAQLVSQIWPRMKFDYRIALSHLALF